MIRWALTFIVNRLIIIGVFLVALNAFMPNSSCQYGNSEGIVPTLAGLHEAFRVLSSSFR